MKKRNLDLINKSESKEQIGFVQWLRRNYPDVIVYHVPNGRKRSKVEGALLKAEGVLPGVPDLAFPGLMLYIEMKEGKGALSPKQKELIPRLRARGYTVYTPYTTQEAIECFNEHLDNMTDPEFVKSILRLLAGFLTAFNGGLGMDIFTDLRKALESEI